MIDQQRGSGPIAGLHLHERAPRDEDHEHVAHRSRLSPFARGAFFRDRPRRVSAHFDRRTIGAVALTGSVGPAGTDLPDLDDPEDLVARNPTVAGASGMPAKFAVQMLSGVVELDSVSAIRVDQIAYSAPAVFASTVTAGHHAAAAAVSADGWHLPFENDPHRAPEGFPIKGNEGSMKYHLSTSPSYATTIPEVWFATAEAAESKGFSEAYATSTQPQTEEEAP